MKRAFEFKMDEERYMLISTNPNEQRAPFEIGKREMQFDTNAFYQYVFSDISTETEIEIVDKTEENDKVAKRICRIISEIVDGVMKKMNERVLGKL